MVEKKEFVWICPCCSRVLSDDEDYQWDDPLINYCAVCGCVLRDEKGNRLSK